MKSFLNKLSVLLFITFVQPFQEVFKDYLVWQSKRIDAIIHKRVTNEINRAKRRADKMHEASGKRHYVIASPSGKPIVVNREGIRLAQRKGMIDKSVDGLFLLNNAIYITRSKQ